MTEVFSIQILTTKVMSNYQLRDFLETNVPAFFLHSIYLIKVEFLHCMLML